ncbi:hypothetical protein [Budvicia aquatica]|uniref:Lipoprotein n=1 Tax=Budvicia aquatica TaxID=82979 RepID=A0A2C6DRR8_9GAMM|nr:hypothetical protein [Budvicia aquatica]PHI31022.1 hypothetical protein CRN84_17625 [Budvicia aquatica]VFS51177.1 Uncharacterised protein [Budvicia aquatica]
MESIIRVFIVIFLLSACSTHPDYTEPREVECIARYETTMMAIRQAEELKVTALKVNHVGKLYLFVPNTLNITWAGSRWKSPEYFKEIKCINSADTDFIHSHR